MGELGPWGDGTLAYESMGPPAPPPPAEAGETLCGDMRCCVTADETTNPDETPDPLPVGHKGRGERLTYDGVGE